MPDITPIQPKQMAIPLPGGLKVKETKDKLVIVRPWSRFRSLPALLVAFLCSGGMLIGSLNMSWASLESFVVGIALLIGGVFGLYLTLVTLLNKTTVSANATTLTIEHGPLPLPPWRGIRLDSTRIKQLYVDEKITSGKGSATYEYQLYALTTTGKSLALFPDVALTEWAQVLYLEQEIERYLGLADQLVTGEPASRSLDPLKGDKRDVWRKLAAANRLDFVQRSPLKGAYLSGLYRGHYLELDTLSKKREEEAEMRTRLLLATTEPSGTADRSSGAAGDQPVILAQVAEALARSGPFPALRGSFEVESGGQKIYYEQSGVEGEYGYLQFLFDIFSDLLTAYPQVITLGGEAVPVLQTILDDETHPLRAVALQLLTEISQATTRRWADQAPRLRCVRCLGRCVDFETRLSPLKSLTYYGCQSCQQSQQFFEFEGRVIAVLDRGMATEQVEQGAMLRVNWLARRGLFSFDQIEIVQADDEEVERFAIQVGNDTDPARQPRYQEMRCLVSAGCSLSDNTLRILRRTFGQVEILDF